ncbi:F-box/LRR-repeat protein At3g58900-like [Papaver somniferum]|uniref:F-box/LRR-repeat protein At3g58900-like n=1 Tax=Papaver somniferum TaxID=3469 RepID=UPI000E6F4B27|nr:F-box/LRR-repeat protein At3g58900-like [Papaver somniferum]
MVEKISSFGNEENEVDRISMLPNELIHHIMSFSDTKYGVQTCVLSKRWIHIWKSLPFLNFDCCYYPSVYARPVKFNNFINGVFKLRNDCDIQWFRLRFYKFSSSATASVSRWVDTAVEHNVQEVTLKFHQAYNSVMTYEIPLRLLNCKSLKKLTLLSYGSDVHIVLPNSMSLPQLMFMCLGGIALSNAGLSKRLFSSCPLLETLNLVNCDIQTDNQGNFTVESLGLKKFEYTYHHSSCDPRYRYRSSTSSSSRRHHLNPKMMKLSSPNLISFTGNYGDKNQQLFAEEKEVNAIHMVKLLVAVYKVEQLDLSPGFLESKTTSMVYIGTHYQHSFHCLDIGKLLDAGDDWEVGFSFPGMLSHLSTVRIEEIVGCDAELKLLSFLLENAKVLEEVTLYPITNSLRRVRNQFMKKLRALPRASSRIKMGMDFTHLVFYNGEVTLDDVLRKPQRVPERSLYKFVIGAETRLEQALALIDMLALEELVEFMRFARMRKNIISSERDHHHELEGMFEEMAECIAMDDAEAAALDAAAASGVAAAPDASAGGGDVAPDTVAAANAPGSP